MAAEPFTTSSPALEQTFRRAWPYLITAQRPLVTHSAPGRIDVLGGMAAEVGGVVAQMTLARRASVALQWRTDGQLAIYSSRTSTTATPIPVILHARDFPAIGGRARKPEQILQSLPSDQTWAAPLVALFDLLLIHPRLAADEPLRNTQTGDFSGATVLIQSNIPFRAGMGSSTAMVTALAQSICRSLPITINTIEKAVLIQQAESIFSNTGSHVVDALTALCTLDGPPSHLLRFNAQPHDLIGQIPLSPDIKILAINTGVPVLKSAMTVRSLRLAGAMGLQIIQVIYNDLGRENPPLHGYLGNLSPTLYRRYFRALLPRRLRGRDFVRTYGHLPKSAGEIQPEQLYRVRTAVDHLISEHEHAEHFLQEMEQIADLPMRDRAAQQERELTLRRAGRLLLASHHSYRLRLGLSCWEADWLIDQLMSVGPERGIYGGRISDCGGGGTLTILTDSSGTASDALLQIMSDYKRTTGITLGVDVAGAAGSAGALLTMS